MHELAVTQQIIAIASEEAKKAGAKRVTAVNLVIGDLASFVDECISFYWDILSRDSGASGASINFIRRPAIVRCHNCGNEFRLKQEEWQCPGCGHWDVEVISGKEFYIDSIEVE